MYFWNRKYKLSLLLIRHPFLSSQLYKWTKLNKVDSHGSMKCTAPTIGNTAPTVVCVWPVQTSLWKWVSKTTCGGRQHDDSWRGGRAVWHFRFWIQYGSLIIPICVGYLVQRYYSYWNIPTHVKSIVVPEYLYIHIRALLRNSAIAKVIFRLSDENEMMTTQKHITLYLSQYTTVTLWGKG